MSRKGAKKPAVKRAGPRKPPHWDKIVSAAYLRMLGRSQKATALAVGNCERSVREWESRTETWQMARAEARSRWLNDAEDAARGAVMTSLELGNGDLGLKLLERLDEQLAPAKQRAELTGKDGGPIEVATSDLRERIAGRIAGIASRIGTGGDPGGPVPGGAGGA